MGNIFLETERLNLRQMDVDDFLELSLILKDREVMAAWEYDFTDKDVYGWINKNKELYERYGLGYFLLQEKSSGNIVGQAALMLDRINGEEYYEIGYILKRECWGQGYATEAAVGLAKYAKEKLCKDVVIFEIRPENNRSRRVAERLGAKECGSFIKNVRGKEMNHLIYKLFMVN